jgi:hypothetical protein
MNNKSWKNKRNTCLPFTSSLTNAARMILYSDNVNDNIDVYLFLINNELLDCVSFTDKQQFDILF